RFADTLLAIGIAWCDMAHIDQQRLIDFSTPEVSTGSQRAQRVAVVALASSDNPATLRHATFNKILARQFERGLYCLRAAREKINVIEVTRGCIDEQRRQVFGGLVCEEARMRECQFCNRLLHRL